MPAEVIQNHDDDDGHWVSAVPLDLADPSSPFIRQNDVEPAIAIANLSQNYSASPVDCSASSSSSDTTSERMPALMPGLPSSVESEHSEDPMAGEAPPPTASQGTAILNSSASATSPVNPPTLPSLPSPFNPAERFGRNLLLDAIMSGLLGASPGQVNVTPDANSSSPDGATAVPLPDDGAPNRPAEGAIFPNMLQALAQLQQNQNDHASAPSEAQGGGAASSSGSGGGRQVPVVIFGVRAGPPQRHPAGTNASSPTSVSTNPSASSTTGSESASQGAGNIPHHGILNSITEMFSGLSRQRANRANARTPAGTNDSPANTRDAEQWRLFVVALTDQPTVVGSASPSPTDVTGGGNPNPPLPNLASLFAPRPPRTGEAAPAEGIAAPPLAPGSAERNGGGPPGQGQDGVGTDPLLAMLLQVILGILVSGGAPGGEGAGGNGYEDLLRLAELLGPGRPRNASSADVEREIPTVIYSRAELASDSQQMRGKKRRKRTEGGGGEGKRSRLEGKGKGREDAGREEMDVDGGHEEEYSDEEMVDVSNDGTLRVADLLGGTHERCTVCLMEYEDGDELRILRCAHGFHKACLDRWATSYVNSCPICRKPCVEATNNNNNNGNAEIAEAGGAQTRDRPVLPPWLNPGAGVAGAIPISFTHEPPELPPWLTAIPRPPTPPLGFLRSRRHRRTMPMGQSTNEWNIEVHINIESENPADGQNGGEENGTGLGNDGSAGGENVSRPTEGGGRRRSSRGTVRSGQQNGGILPDFMSSVRDLFRRFSGGREGSDGRR